MPTEFTATKRLKEVRAYKLLTSKLNVIVFLAFFLLAVGALGGIIFPNLYPVPSDVIQGIGLLSLGVAGSLINIIAFASTYYRSSAPPKDRAQVIEELESGQLVNVADAASFELLLSLYPEKINQDVEAFQAQLLNLTVSKNVQELLIRLQLDLQEVSDEIKKSVLPELTVEIFAKNLLNLSIAQNADLTPEYAFGSLLLHENMRSYLRQHDLNKNDIIFVLWWVTASRKIAAYKRKWWKKERLLGFTGLGLSWTAGYTPLVDQFARIPKGNLWDDVIWGHEEKLEQLIISLARLRQSNVLVAGQPGVGRLGLVRALSQRVSANNAHKALNGQRVVYIHVGELLSQTNSSAGQLSIVSRVLSELERAGNIIAVIGGLGSILGEEGEQRINMTDALLPFLSSLTVRVVVIVSSDEYHLRLKNNEELAHMFEVVQVPSLSGPATLQRLSFKIPDIEARTNITVPYKAMRACVESTEAIFPNIPYPERAFDVLEEALVYAQNQQVSVLTEEHITSLISKKVGIPLGAMREQERGRLLNLETIMHERLVNQDIAVKAVTRAMIRARARTRSLSRPVGSFLFLGPTGVGKTETAKTLAESYFGSEEKMLRIDMSEFQGADGVGRLIGSADNPTGRLTSMVADQPFSVLLLDEFEKADPAIHQLFLQVFDEGHITNARGQTISFKHTIIIATSNAGAELIRQNVQDDGKLPPDFNKQLREHILRNNIFRPELINRFDAVVTFTPLTSQHLQQIAQLMLKKLNKRLDSEHGITIAITPELIAYITEIGYNPEFGARPMTRAIQDTIEYWVARKVVSGQFEPGQTIALTPQMLEEQQPAQQK